MRLGYSSSSANHSLRERSLHSNAIHTELSTLHPEALHDMEIEEYVLALITESNPLRYLGSVFKSWFKDKSSSLSPHGLLTSKHQAPSNSPSLETSEHEASRQYRLSWTTVASIIFLKSLLLFAKPVEIFGNAFEYWFNMVYLNHGLKRTLHTCLFNRDALKKPCCDDEDYYSLTGLVDPRQELHLQDGILSDVSKLDNDFMKNMADVCVMASKIAYENEKVIKKAVEQTWKMNFVEFFNCWNAHLDDNTTQGFIFTDTKQDANIVVVAFRGTQAFNMKDWCTDFDFSYYVLPEIGRVHVGFLEALGLGTRLQKETLKQAKDNTRMKANEKILAASPTSGLSEKVINDDDKVLAYDAICAKVRTLLRQNLGAKLYITGHSLGGALATVFSALLLAEGSKTCESLGGIFTFGQPRVGDAKFAKFMEEKLCKTNPRKYFRVVYRTDIVPRMPFDDQVFQFRHISPCHYYISCSESKALHEEPYKGLFLLMLQPMPHYHALKELYGSLRSRFGKRGEGYMETGLCVAVRFWALLCPGLCAHFPTHYIDAVRRAPSPFYLQVENLEMKYWASLTSSINLRAFTWLKFSRWSRSSSTEEHMS